MLIKASPWHTHGGMKLSDTDVPGSPVASGWGQAAEGEQSLHFSPSGVQEDEENKEPWVYFQFPVSPSVSVWCTHSQVLQQNKQKNLGAKPQPAGLQMLVAAAQGTIQTRHAQNIRAPVWLAAGIASTDYLQKKNYLSLSTPQLEQTWEVPLGCSQAQVHGRAEPNGSEDPPNHTHCCRYNTLPW